MEKSKKIKFLIGLFYLLILTLFLWYFFNNFSIDEISSYEFIKKNRDSIENFKDNNFLIVIIIFFIFTIIWVLFLGFGIPIGLLGGFIFGKWMGALIVSFSLTVGATLLYIFVGFFLKNFIKEKFEKKFYFLAEKFKKNEFLYLLFYRFIGGIPFFLANILPILFNVKIKNYFLGTLIGIIPSIFIFTSLGNGLDKIINENLERPSIFNLITSEEIYVPIILFLFLITIVFFIKKKF